MVVYMQKGGIILNKLIILITFIPWIINFYANLLDIYRSIDYQKLPALEWLKKNFFKEFRIDALIIILIFIYFSNFDKLFVCQYLFLVMNLYFYINSLYDTKHEIKKLACIKNNYKEMLLVNLISFLPFVYYYFTKNLVSTYLALFAITFLNFILITLIRLLKEKLAKKD